MMATAHPKLALRPYLPEDASLHAEIFRASVMDLTSDDYTESPARPTTKRLSPRGSAAS
jgi:putative acetyltransferase